MTFDDIIRSRRSIRAYTDEVPDNRLITAMLESASFAPSPSHSQPVRFILIENQDLKNNLQCMLEEGRDRLIRMIEEKGLGKTPKNLVRAYYRFAEFLVRAPLLFAVGTLAVRSFSDRLIEAGVLDENPKGFWDADISTGLALSSFMLKATELGLGTCVLTAPFVFIPELSRKIHPEIRVTCFVTVGYPGETPRALNRISAEDLCLIT